MRARPRRPVPGSFETRGGIRIERSLEEIPVEGAIEGLSERLDSCQGAVLASRFEYPGRYERFEFGFVNPPLEISARSSAFRITARNARGCVLLPALTRVLENLGAVDTLESHGDGLQGTVKAPAGRFPEEERSRQPSIFSVIRELIELFGSDEDPHLGLFGAFGYDLAFQFESLKLRLPRRPEQRDLVLYLPDELIVVDHRREGAMRISYELEVDGSSTQGLARDGEEIPYRAATSVDVGSDHRPGEYADGVREARKAFARGDLFEVVPGQTLTEACPEPPSVVFQNLLERNPSPYGFLLNLGEEEYLVGASPEMYVRVEGDRVETCPIAGTIPRGRDPLEDAEQIRTILNSVKEESELTMCTDVDRNDKSRICVPGSVKVIGRRQIEMYSRLIHTVDHVEGRLAEGFDALDAFLVHTWAVTVTGAPKVWAMQFIEDHEKSARCWYGGAVGVIGFDGHLNTGLTLRTIRVKDGVAEVRVGATLLFDSNPDAEEAETHLKASALLDAIRRPPGTTPDPGKEVPQTGKGKRVVLVDHQDSFVHTLAGYFRQTGAEVTTLRAGFPHQELDSLTPDLVVLSPGPGRPEDFDVTGTVAACLERSLPLFGVCLGLQGIVEAFGGKLDILDTPVHGKPSSIRTFGGRLFADLPETFRAGRYHSLHAKRECIPSELCVTAESEDGVVMAVEHESLPIAAVQFHPESILSLEQDRGLRLISNVVGALCRP